ncbi:protein ALP1-like, partial [Aphis craccivora]
FLATGCSFRSLAFTFRMGNTIISNIVVETCSAIWNKLLTTYLPEPTVGDEAFPLLVNILRPYPGKQLVNNIKKKVFNYRLSRARRTIENTYGIACSKWRILNKAIKTNVEITIIITKAVCILHNVVLTHSKHPTQNLQHLSDEKIADISDGRRNNRICSSGASTRQIFADYFINEYGSVPWQMDYI